MINKDFSKKSVGDRVEIIDDRGARSASGRIGQMGTIVGIEPTTENEHERLCRVRMDIDNELVSMCAYRFRKGLEELPYDPSQQGDLDDDI